MKSKKTVLTISDNDKKYIKKALVKHNRETGAKENIKEFFKAVSTVNKQNLTLKNSSMKTERILIRVSEEERKQLEKAVTKFHRETGAKENVSAAIRYIVMKYTTETAKQV